MLKRLNDSSDQSTNRKRRRLDSTDKNVSNNVTASASGSNTSMPVLTTKMDSLSKFARSLVSDYEILNFVFVNSTLCSKVQAPTARIR